MKKVAKAFLIVSVVFNSIGVFFTLISFFACCATCAATMAYEPSVSLIVSVVTFIYLLICTAILIYSIIALKQVCNAVNPNDISMASKICILLFANTISGILLLCWQEPKNENAQSVNDDVYTLNTVSTSKSTSKPIDFESLEKLKKLLDMGIITQEEFEAKKKEYL